MATDLTGTWQEFYGEVDGRMGPVARTSSTVITYQGNKFSITVFGKLEHEGTYSVNDGSSPAQITFVYTKSSRFELNKPRTGILQLVGDTVKICIGPVGAPAPSNFNTTANSNAVLTIHQRKGSEGGAQDSFTVGTVRAILW